MSSAIRHIWTCYLEGWKSLFQNWKVLAIVYIINILLAFIAIGPLSNSLEKALSSTTIQNEFVSSFDYDLVADFLREYGLGIDLSVSIVGSFLVLYWLWSCFYFGGWMSVIRQDQVSNFWSGGAKYFFRFLRLSFYIIVFSIFLLFLCYLLFSKGGLSPFLLDSEHILIARFWWLLASFCSVFFFIAIFRDLAKIYIVRDNYRFITKSNIKALKSTFLPRVILLILINVIGLCVVGLVYYLLKSALGGVLLASLITGQLFLIFRMSYRYVRLASIDRLIPTE